MFMNRFVSLLPQNRYEVEVGVTSGQEFCMKKVEDCLCWDRNYFFHIAFVYLEKIVFLRC